MNTKNSSRRDFLKTVGLGTAALTLPAGSVISKVLQKRANRKKPNVLFIAIDDLNHWIGCMRGYPGLKTPNIDRISQRGVLFNNAHCVAPSCNPSRASLLTGIYPSTSGVYGNTQPWRKSPVLKNATTLQKYFKDNGYWVAGAGKIDHVKRNGYFDADDWHTYNEPEGLKPTPGKPDEWPVRGMYWGPLDRPDEQMEDWQNSEWIAQQLHKKHDKPFFMACGIKKPHLNWMVPKKYFDMHPLEDLALPDIKQDDTDDLPEIAKNLIFSNVHDSIINSENWRSAVQAYLACISFVDVCVGRLLDSLDKSSYRDNTVIILWSDHGWHLGQKGHWKKFVLWEEATHAPLMFIAPGITTAGQKCERAVSFIDIYPTLVDLCGLPPKKELEGISLVPLLKNVEHEWKRPALTTLDRGGVCHSLRSDRWRYIQYSDGSEELYDHENDQQEWDNLAHKAEFAQVKKDLIRWLPKTNAAPSPKNKSQGKKKKQKK